MTHNEAISILMKHDSEEAVMSYIVNAMKSGENYLKNFDEDKLLNDYNMRKYIA